MVLHTRMYTYTDIWSLFDSILYIHRRILLAVTPASFFCYSVAESEVRLGRYENWSSDKRVDAWSVLGGSQRIPRHRLQAAKGSHGYLDSLWTGHRRRFQMRYDEDHQSNDGKCDLFTRIKFGVTFSSPVFLFIVENIFSV